VIAGEGVADETLQVFFAHDGAQLAFGPKQVRQGKSKVGVDHETHES